MVPEPEAEAERDADPRRLTRRGALALAGGGLAGLGGCVADTRVGTGGSTPATAATADGAPPTGPAAPEGSWPQLADTAGHAGAAAGVSGAEPDERWGREVEGPVTTPTVVDDTVYVARGAPTDAAPRATVEAYALDSGDRRWSLPLEAGGEPVAFAFSAPNSDRRPVYYRGRLYLSVGSAVAAVDPAGPEQVWTTDPVEDLHFNEPPTVAASGVYAGGPFGLAAFDHDGSERWVFPETATDDDPLNDPTGSPRVPAATDDAVYVPMGATLLELDPADGTERWRHEADHRGGSTVVRAGDALVRSSVDAVGAVGTDGESRWTADWPGEAVVRPAVADDAVYVAGLEGHVAAYDRADGERLWHTRLGPERFVQGTVATVSDGGVHCLRVDRANRTVAAVALDREDGSERWRVERPGTRARGVVPAEGSYLFTTETTPESRRERSTVTAGQDTTATLWAFEPADSTTTGSS